MTPKTPTSERAEEFRRRALLLWNEVSLRTGYPLVGTTFLGELARLFSEMERESGAVSEWREISTAPKDGTPVLAYGAKRLEWAVAYWSERDQGWLVETCSETLNIYPPKFWMPLPARPQEGE